MVDQLDALLNIHIEPEVIILDDSVVSSKKCSTTTKTKSYVDQSLTSSIVSASVHSLHLQEEISEMLSTLTPVTGILSPVACSMTSNLFFSKFPKPFTVISSIPTDLRLVSCIPYNIMSSCVQPRINYALHFNTINAYNVLRNTTFIHGPHLFPIIEHLKYIMKIWYNGKYQTPTIDVIKTTCGTHVTQSFKLKCVEKVSVTKQQNGNGINLYNPQYNFNNNEMNETNNRENHQTSTNDQITVTNFQVDN